MSKNGPVRIHPHRGIRYDWLFDLQMVLLLSAVEEAAEVMVEELSTVEEAADVIVELATVEEAEAEAEEEALGAEPVPSYTKGTL